MGIKFQVPYNFASDYIGKMSQHTDLFKHIRFVYLPAWKEDALNSRMNIAFENEYPKTYDEYVIHIKLLQALGLTVCILGQKSITYETVEKYYAMGIRHFVLNNDELAVVLKEKHDDIYLGLSITRNLTFAEICNEGNDFSMYDEIILHHWFARHLTEVKQLPDKYNYTMIANSSCYYGCKWGPAHWYAIGENPEEYLKAIRPSIEKCQACIHDIRDTAYIEPENLHYFDSEVVAYKLVDREWPTDRIINALQEYVERNPVVPRDEAFYNLP